MPCLPSSLHARQPAYLHRHLHGNAFMGIIARDDEVGGLPAVDNTVAGAASAGAGDLEGGEVPRFARQLLAQGRRVVYVHVRVAHDVRQRPRHQPRSVRHHVRQ